MCWSWEVHAEEGFSEDDIRKFLDIATNAIERHGKDDCHNVAGEIRDGCEDEWGFSGQSWVAVFDTNGAFSVRCSPDKSIDLKGDNNRGNGVFVYAARLTVV